MLLSFYQVFWRYWAIATNFGPEWRAARVLEWHQLRGELENVFEGLSNDVGGRIPSHRGSSYQHRLFPDWGVGVQPFHRVQAGSSSGPMPEMNAPDRPMEDLCTGETDRLAGSVAFTEAGG